MIDIHTHLIPNVDDGSNSVEYTFEAFKEAEQAGFTDIILTSHYLTEYYEPKPEELNFWKDKLQEILISKNQNLRLHSGMEIYISEKLDELIKENKLLTLAGSKYMLLELPMSTNVAYLDHVIYVLESMGIKTIIAHPERYKNIQKNFNIIEEYIEKGCLIQCNYGSVLGDYGKEAKKTIKNLLKKNFVHFMGTDCHRSFEAYSNVEKAIKKMEKLIGKEKVYEITTSNPQKILNNENW